MCTSGSTATTAYDPRIKTRSVKYCRWDFSWAAAGYYIGMKEAFIRVWVNNVRKK